MNSNHFINFCIVTCLSIEFSLQGQSIEKIHEPVFVGRPPENAFNGLVQLPNGELRHYGFEGPQRNPTNHLYIKSIDNGLTWQRILISDTV